MNAWRCNNQECHQMFTDQSVGHDGKLLVCADCGDMVCNVTSTRIGQEFLDREKKHVPSRVKYQYMNKTIKFADGEG
jgi:hypothetical protein